MLLAFRDTGPGIPEHFHRCIFELFTRVPASEASRGAQMQSGSGVGLAVVKQIVEHHDGEVWVESAPGEGTSFFVKLPWGVSG